MTSSSPRRSRFRLEDGVILVDRDRRVTFANPAARAVLGRPGQPLDAVLADDEPLRALVARAIESGTAVNSVPIALPGAGEAEVLVSVFPLGSADRVPGGAIVLLKDVRSLTVWAHTLQSLIRYSGELAALGRATSQVTHDIKNPLNALMIHLEILGASAPPGAQKSLEVMRREIRRLDDLIARFMDLIRAPEIGRGQLDLSALLTDVTTLLGAEWGPKGIVFTRALAPSLPLVIGDEDLLRQTFVNLLGSACQAMPGEGEVRIEADLDESGLARVVVSDTGRERSGTDLALVRRIIEVHGGTVEILSEVGRGTQVVVRLPGR
ncbi:MAG: PAS domain-containing protein [Candidatus Rokubacteria bacterium]|nr:PAS domain-containing protein [Candidatus Rokubacteria bacterium]